MSNYQLQLKERRMSGRKKLSGLMPGKLKISGQEMNARAVDISEHGLGILMTEECKIGASAEMILKDSVVHFEIKWMEPDFGKHDRWRYGLVCTDMGVNVAELFAKLGYFK